MTSYIDEHQPAIIALFTQTAVLCARERGVGIDLLLAGTGLSEALLQQRDAYITIAQHRLFISNAYREVGNPAFGLEVGLNFSVGMLGALGYAVLASDSPQESCELICKYTNTFHSACHPEFFWTEQDVIFRLQVDLPVDELYIHLVEVAFSYYLTYLRGMSVDLNKGLRISCAYDEPSHSDSYRNLFGDTVDFCKSFNEVSLPISSFGHLTMHGNEIIRQFAERECKSLQLSAGRRSELSETIRRRLLRDTDKMPTHQDLARELGMSRRSFARRLAESGISFTEIAADTRKQLACSLLAHSEATIEEIALRLGYESPPNFTRSFKQWTGETPSNYRKKSSNK